MSAILSIFKDYFRYGNNFSFNIFVDKLWYKNISINQNTINISYNQFFKRFFYTNSTLGIEHSFLLRNTTAEFFDIRPWVLYYNNWLIIIICWFKPLKPRNKKALISTNSVNVKYKEKAPLSVSKITHSLSMHNSIQYKF